MDGVIKKVVLVVMGMLVIVGMGWWMMIRRDPRSSRERFQTVPYLEKYDFDSLRQVYKVNKVSKVYKAEILGKIKEVEDRRKEKYDFETRQIRFLSNNKWITGMMNRPIVGNGLRPFRTILMVRGYAEKAGYYSGSGSWRVADELAKEGYATISLDFLGYGGSEAESEDMLEARFEKVVSLLDLMETVKQLPWVDKNKIGIWAHSNGGQIVLSVLEITGENYPTVLWAPMTQKFPESVLSTIDEGSSVKGEIESFLKFYDARRYAFENYLEWIRAPILILQGTADEWVKVEWQKDLVNRLKGLRKQAELVIYKGADHNLNGGWGEGVERTKNWYNF